MRNIGTKSHVKDGAARIAAVNKALSVALCSGPWHQGQGRRLGTAEGVPITTSCDGNPADAPMLVPAIAYIIARFGRARRLSPPTRGYGEAAVDESSARAAVTEE